MAIRDVGNKPQVGAGAAGGLPPTLEKGLGDAGLLKQGGSPKDAAQGLLSNLKRAGFDAPPGAAKGDLANQLSTSLKQFQQVSSLQKTGQLDAATQTALKNAGIIGNPEAQQASSKAQQDGFEKGGAGLLKGGEKGRADAMNNQTPDTNFLDALINQLGTGGPNEGTSPSDVKGAKEAAESQTQMKASEAKKGEGAQKKGVADKEKEVELPSNQQMDKGTAAGVKVARGLKTEQAKTDEKKRKDALAGKDPTEMGLLDEEADEDAVEGNGEDGQRKRGRGGDGDGGAEEGSDASGAEGGERDGEESHKGNASSGDDDAANKKRGHASGDGEDGEGFYRMPSMSEQAFASLEKIIRDVSAENRATTYSWDVTFFKPGIYGAGQKAQELVHLVVDKATAFNPVWQKAQANLNILVKRTDPDGAVPSLDDIIGAIRQARARDGDDTASKLTKVTRPMGRA